MVQYIKQANPFGRLGESVGNALSEQIPKEIERKRLSQGLKNISQQKGLSPLEQYAEVVRHTDNPEIIRQSTELIKQHQIRDAYKNRANRLTQNEEQQPSPQIEQRPLGSNINFGEMPGRIARTPQGQPQTVPSDMPRQQEAISNPPAANQNPLEQQFIPSGPWTQNHQERAINEAFDRGLATNFDEASQYANQQKQIFETAPQKYREQYEYKKGVDQEVDDRFDKDLAIRLQKEGAETYKDLNGNLQLNLKKQARNAVATGKMTPQQAAEYYTKKSLDLVKAKGRAREIANRDVWDRISPTKKEEAIKNLMHIGKTFDDLGSSEDFYNFLRDDRIDPISGAQEGLGLSPGGSAIISYRRSTPVKDLISKTRINSKNASENTRAFAENLVDKMSPRDSFLAIARQMKEQDSNFDEYAFFDYLRENQDRYASNPRLNLEVSQGVSDFNPNWRDVGLFPAFTKSVAND